MYKTERDRKIKKNKERLSSKTEIKMNIVWVCHMNAWWAFTLMLNGPRPHNKMTGTFFTSETLTFTSC